MNSETMEMLRPLRHKVWGWQAVVNFHLGGMAAGMFLLAHLYGFLRNGGPEFSEPFVVKVLPQVLASLGFFAVALEAGRPSRAPYLLRNLWRSWMSREMAAGGLFIVFGTLDAFSPSPFFAAIAGASALLLLISHGFIVFRSIAVRSWNRSIIPVFFLTSAFWSGWWAMLVARSLAGLVPGGDVFAIGLVLGILDYAIWLAYLFQNRRGDIQNSLASLFFAVSRRAVMITGYIIPLLVIIFLTQKAAVPLNRYSTALMLIAGLAAIAGSLMQKAELILQDNYLVAVRMGKPLMRRL